MASFPFLAQSDRDGPTPNFLETIKKNTSEWTDLVLPFIRIKFDTCVPSSAINNVFTNGVLHFIEKSNLSEVVNLFWFRSEENREKSECFQHAMRDVFDIDCYHIDDIDVRDILKLNQIERSRWVDNFVERSDKNQRPVRERICREMFSSLKIFTWHLLYMLRRRKGNNLKELSDGMYQELFVSFARIFGLNVVSGASVEKYSLTINEENFVAKPDALICLPTVDGDDKIFAVVEVKRCSQDEDTEKVRILSNVKNKSDTCHVGSSLKGEHCGQFLCTLPYSVFETKGMYGFIVQGTNVTLTVFQPEEGYHESLCRGYLHNKNAEITYSKEYNILIKEDRNHLAQIFLDIGQLVEYLCEKKS